MKLLHSTQNNWFSISHNDGRESQRDWRGWGTGADILSPILCINLKHVLKQCIWATLEAGIYVTLLAPGVLVSRGLGIYVLDLGLDSSS